MTPQPLSLLQQAVVKNEGQPWTVALGPGLLRLGLHALEPDTHREVTFEFFSHPTRRLSLTMSSWSIASNATKPGMPRVMEIVSREAYIRLQDEWESVPCSYARVYSFRPEARFRGSVVYYLPHPHGKPRQWLVLAINHASSWEPGAMIDLQAFDMTQREETRLNIRLEEPISYGGHPEYMFSGIVTNCSTYGCDFPITGIVDISTHRGTIRTN